MTIFYIPSPTQYLQLTTLLTINKQQISLLRLNENWHKVILWAQNHLTKWGLGGIFVCLFLLSCVPIKSSI